MPAKPENMPSSTLCSPRAGGLLARALCRRHGGVVIFIAVFLAVSMITRVALLIKAAHEIAWQPSLLAVFGWGLLYDLGAAAFASLPLTLLLTLAPAGFFARRSARWLVVITSVAILFALWFGLVSEWAFWDEFGVRFNFIAVDYLVYTKEVVGNINESYNLLAIIGGVLAAALASAWLVWRTSWPLCWLSAADEPAGRRWLAGSCWFAGALGFASLVSADWLPEFKNNFNREIGKNGLWSLFAAFQANHLNYDDFYPTLPLDEAFATVRQNLTEDGSVMVDPQARDTLRQVTNPGPELRLNVIQITVESLSAAFLGHYNPSSKLTPELDALAAKSLVFENFYATGTRTDRGLEALSLSLPPTPGRSLVKRPHNEHLFTLGSVFRGKGYDTAFIYGGYGYFDNMNDYFGHNGYRVIDRAGVAAKDVTFGNVWGACDGDLFNWVLRDADAASAGGKPFHQFVMTTSNHRPYTFPAGCIDLPSKTSGRDGAVKYTDYAIGKFIRDASSRPWFNQTVFVIVADHCAASAGKSELPVQNYHIPLMIYAPGGQIASGRITALASQVDFAPTMLGLLHWSYQSRFFGRDARRLGTAETHSLLGNYQQLGMLKGENFIVLKPLRIAEQYRYHPHDFTLTHEPLDDTMRNEAVSFYQTANWLYLQRGYGEVKQPGT
jgi:phosphoglycerol transferase MdoB-like AlkP superfamily enzyme